MKAELQQALDLLKQRDAAVVDRALPLLQRTVYSFSMKVCGHREDAEDTSQDVLVRALPHLSNFDNANALAVWLYKTARNCCVSSRRRSRYAPAPGQNLSLDELMSDGRELDQLIASREATAEAKLLSAEQSERVRDAVLALSPQYRLPLVLHDMEELDAADVARILDLREGTVRVRLHRARLFLRRELARGAQKRRPPATPPPREPRCRRLFAALSDYLDAIVDDATCAQMQLHLSECAPCEAFLDSLKRTVEQCRQYSPECSPERLAALREQLVRQYAQAAEALSGRPRPDRIGTVANKRPPSH